jgi:hypothetical protein
MLDFNSILVMLGFREELDFDQFSNFRQIADTPQKIAAIIVSRQRFYYSKRA